MLNRQALGHRPLGLKLANALGYWKGRGLVGARSLTMLGIFTELRIPHYFSTQRRILPAYHNARILRMGTMCAGL